MKKQKIHNSVCWDSYGISNNPNKKAAKEELSRLKQIQERIELWWALSQTRGDMMRKEKINQLKNFIKHNYWDYNI